VCFYDAVCFKPCGWILSSTKTPSQTTTVTSRIMMPTDANVAGSVFGGSILKLIDEVVAMAAFKHARKNVVTASIDRMDFHSPVHVGDMLRLIANVNYVHQTSMEVGVRVESEQPQTGKITHTGTCYLTFVCLDQNDHPTQVLPLQPGTADEKRRWREAEDRRKMRLTQLALEKH
jgi:acyl-CoA hydrolase